MILDILGFKAQVKDYLIFFKYTTYSDFYANLDKLYVGELRLVICFKKEEYIDL